MKKKMIIKILDKQHTEMRSCSAVVLQVGLPGGPCYKDHRGYKVRRGLLVGTKGGLLSSASDSEREDADTQTDKPRKRRRTKKKTTMRRVGSAPDLLTRPDGRKKPGPKPRLKVNGVKVRRSSSVKGGGGGAALGKENSEVPGAVRVVAAEPRTVFVVKAGCREGLLDQLVPQMGDPGGADNPFRTQFECQADRRRQRHVAARLVTLGKEYAPELQALRQARSAAVLEIDTETTPWAPTPPSSSSSPSPPKLSPAPRLQDTKNTNVANGMPPLHTLSPKPGTEPAKRGGKGGKKRKRSPSPEANPPPGLNVENLEDGARRSKRARLSAQKYQHLLASFPRRLPAPEAPADGEGGPGKRWKWMSVVDQLTQGERFRVLATCVHYDGDVENSGKGAVSVLFDWRDTEDFGQ